MWTTTPIYFDFGDTGNGSTFERRTIHDASVKQVFALTMHFSQYLEDAVFRAQSPATAQLFEAKSNQLFEANSERSSIEIHVQHPFKPHRKEPEHEPGSSCISPRWHSDVSSDTEVKSAPAFDTVEDFHRDPPGYIGSREPQVYTITDSKKLAQVAAVSTLPVVKDPS